jgi:hypothetical protein
MGDGGLAATGQSSPGERDKVPDGSTDEEESPDEKKDGNGNRGDRPSRP